MSDFQKLDKKHNGLSVWWRDGFLYLERQCGNLAMCRVTDPQERESICATTGCGFGTLGRDTRPD